MNVRQLCFLQVTKQVPQCGHYQEMDCGLDPALFARCDGPCQRKLACGHPCTLQCSEDCSACSCEQSVPQYGDCGHEIMVTCSLRDSFGKRAFLQIFSARGKRRSGLLGLVLPALWLAKALAEPITARRNHSWKAASSFSSGAEDLLESSIHHLIPLNTALGKLSKT